MTWQNPKKLVRVSALNEFLNTDLRNLEVLEFGAFASPTLDRNEANVSYADRLSTEELRKSVNNEEKRSAIVDVDYVVSADFSERPDKKFDLIIANHVIEHIPNVICWLNNIAVALKPGGSLFVAVPDKRFTFDIGRKETLAREIVDSYVINREQPSPAIILDAAFHRQNIKVGGDVWFGKVQMASPMQQDLDVDKFLKDSMARINSGEYIDAHCNVFTELSFFAVFREIENMGLNRLTLQSVKGVQKPFNEFHALFRKV